MNIILYFPFGNPFLVYSLKSLKILYLTFVLSDIPKVSPSKYFLLSIPIGSILYHFPLISLSRI